MPEEKKQRITDTSAILLLFTAAILDVLSLIPFIGWVASGIGLVVFPIWFFVLGVGLIRPSRVVTWLLSLVGEAVSSGPFPSLILGVIAVIILVRLEDKTGAKILPLSKGGRIPTRTETLELQRQAKNLMDQAPDFHKRRFSQENNEEPPDG